MKDVPRVPKCVPRWGSAPNHFLMDSKMKSWAIHVQMGALEVIGSNVVNFVKDVLSVPKCVPRWGATPITSLWVPKLNHRSSMFKWGTQKK